jgi:hypothetical protein
MKQHTSEAFAAFVGRGWAAAQHAVCLQAAGTAPREVLSLEPSALSHWNTLLKYGHTILNLREMPWPSDML